MATKAIVAAGTTLTFNSNLVGEIMSVSGARTRTAIEVYTCDSASQAKEFIAGAINEGEVTFHAIYDGSASGVYDSLNTDFLAGTVAACLVTYSDGSTFSCNGLITNLGVPAFGDADADVELDLSIQLSGLGTYTDVSP